MSAAIGLTIAGLALGIAWLLVSACAEVMLSLMADDEDWR
jgi:hypothetical protein